MDETAIVPKAKHWVHEWVDRVKGTITPKTDAAGHIGYMARAGRVGLNAVTGGATGAALGAYHGKFGLDVKGVPLDGLLAGSAALGSVGAAGKWPGLSQFLEKISNDASVVFGFRKGYQVGKGAVLPGSVVAGGAVQRVPAPVSAKVAGEDPIEKVAKGLG